VGPFRALQFQVPPPAADADFMQSFSATVASFHQHVAQVCAGRLTLPNRDFDTGKPTAPGEYRLADRTYAKLLDRLARTSFASASPALRANLLEFYRDLDEPNTRGGGRHWRKTMKDLARLRGITQTN
jgi:hypothetical protein